MQLLSVNGYQGYKCILSSTYYLFIVRNAFLAVKIRLIK